MSGETRATYKFLSLSFSPRSASSPLCHFSVRTARIFLRVHYLPGKDMRNFQKTGELERERQKGFGVTPLPCHFPRRKWEFPSLPFLHTKCVSSIGYAICSHRARANLRRGGVGVGFGSAKRGHFPFHNRAFRGKRVQIPPIGSFYTMRKFAFLLFPLTKFANLFIAHLLFPALYLRQLLVLGFPRYGDGES